MVPWWSNRAVSVGTRTMPLSPGAWCLKRQGPSAHASNDALLFLLRAAYCTWPANPRLARPLWSHLAPYDDSTTSTQLNHSFTSSSASSSVGKSIETPF